MLHGIFVGCTSYASDCTSDALKLDLSNTAGELAMPVSVRELRVFLGYKDSGLAPMGVYYHDESEWSLAVARHSPSGSGWRDGGSGPAQLALAILLRATDRATAVAHYQAFKWDVIAKLPQADFSLRLAKVRDWLASRVDL